MQNESMQAAALLLLAAAAAQPGGSCSSTTLVPNVPAVATYFPDATHRSATAVAADFNGDGITDLVVTGDTGDWILFGTTSGRLISRPLPDSLRAVSAAAADFNGDGKPDLATADQSTISIRLSNGDGTFAADRLLVHGDGTDPITAIAAGDFNGDGKIDLVVASGNGLTVYLAHDGSFTPLPIMAATKYRHTLVVADFDRDGKLDLAVSSWIDSIVTIFRGNGDGTFTIAQQTNFTPDPAKRDVRLAAADVDNDGTLDLVAANQEGLHVLLGNGDASFRDGGLLAVNWDSGAGSPQQIAIADWNNDGLPDAMVAGSFAVAHFVNLGGHFDAPKVYHFAGENIPFLIKSVPIAVFPADFDGDGLRDLIEVDSLGFASTMMSGCPSGSIVRSSSPDSVVAGDSLTLTLYDALGRSTVTTTFSDSGMPIGSGPGTLTTSLATAGTHVITATTPSGTTAPLLLHVHAHASSITMTDAKSHTVFGEPIAISGDVVTDTGEKPGFGNVEIVDGSSVIATIPVINGHYAGSLIELPKTYAFAARFTGAGAWPRSELTATSQHVVVQATTSIRLYTQNSLPPAADICSTKFPPRLNGRWGFLVSVSGPFSPATGAVTLTIPALHVTVTAELFDGVASFGFDRVPAGRYAYTLAFAGTDGYAASQLTGTIVIPTCHARAAAH